MKWTDHHSEGTPGELVASYGRFPTREDDRGRLVVIEWGALPGCMPPPLRIFTVDDVPYSMVRGNHANRTLHEVLVCTRDSLSVRVEHPAEDVVEYELSSGDAVYIPPWRWITVSKMGINSALLVIATAPYARADRIDDRDEFHRGAAA